MYIEIIIKKNEKLSNKLYLLFYMVIMLSYMYQILINISKYSIFLLLLVKSEKEKIFKISLYI